MAAKDISPFLPLAEDFTVLLNGKQTTLHFISNKKITVALTNYGARVVSIIMPDKNGNLVDIVVGPGTMNDFLQADHSYFGATIGRYANRIANGKFSIHNKTYQLATNNGENHLHGGVGGLQTKVWDVVQPNQSSVEFICTSPDGEDGYPGNMKIKVVYTITAHNALEINYEAQTDKDTFFNITNHTYFNLNGGGSIENHELQILANQFTPITKSLIPTGECKAIANTPFDFSKPVLIGLQINEADQQLTYGYGYDHNYILLKQKDIFCIAAEAKGDVSGITMQVHTTEPGIQLYSGNCMKGTNTMKQGTKDDFRTAFCLETQHYPDSPNQPAFPSVLLTAGEKFNSKTVYTFCWNE
jgi:aldose 1-epimerase